LDYVTQQYKLFPVISQAYAFSAVGLHLRNLYLRLNYDIQQGNVELLAEVGKLNRVIKCTKYCTISFKMIHTV